MRNLFNKLNFNAEKLDKESLSERKSRETNSHDIFRKRSWLPCDSIDSPQLHIPTDYTFYNVKVHKLSLIPRLYNITIQWNRIVMKEAGFTICIIFKTHIRLPTIYVLINLQSCNRTCTNSLIYVISLLILLQKINNKIEKMQGKVLGFIFKSNGNLQYAHKCLLIYRIIIVWLIFNVKKTESSSLEFFFLLPQNYYIRLTRSSAKKRLKLCVASRYYIVAHPHKRDVRQSANWQSENVSSV